MDLNDIQSDLEDLHAHGETAEDSLKVLFVKAGQMAMGEIAIGDAEDPEQSTVDDMRSEIVGKTVLACVEYAIEHDLDLGAAVEEELGHMKDHMSQVEAINEAVDSNDPEALADAIGEEGDDGGGPETDERGVY